MPAPTKKNYYLVTVTALIEADLSDMEQLSRLQKQVDQAKQVIPNAVAKIETTRR